MNKLIHITLFAFLLLSRTMYSQNILIKSFGVIENDKDAINNYPKTDQNGEICAIIKVLTNYRGFVWDGDALGITAVIEKEEGYWLYLPHGAKRLTIMHDEYGILRGYTYPAAILEGKVYEMKITVAKGKNTIPEETIRTQFITIISEPDSANVFINEIHQGQTPFQMILHEGEYSYRVVKKGYNPISNNFTLKSSEGRKEFSVVLEQNNERDDTLRNDTVSMTLMKVSFESIPGDAEILINNEPKGKTPSTISLKTDNYLVKLIKDNFFYEGPLEITQGGNTMLKYYLKEGLYEKNPTNTKRNTRLKNQSKEFFTNIIYGSQGAGIRDLGVCFGSLDVWGWFVQLEWYQTKVRNEVGYNYNGLKVVNYEGNGYYTFDNKVSNYRAGGTLGIIRKVDLINFYMGCGYGISEIYWHINEYSFADYSKISTSWVRNEERTFRGFEYNAGIMFRLKKINFSAGITSVGFKMYEIKTGLGIFW